MYNLNGCLRYLDAQNDINLENALTTVVLLLRITIYLVCLSTTGCLVACSLGRSLEKFSAGLLEHEHAIRPKYFI